VSEGLGHQSMMTFEPGKPPKFAHDGTHTLHVLWRVPSGILVTTVMGVREVFDWIIGGFLSPLSLVEKLSLEGIT